MECMKCQMYVQLCMFLVCKGDNYSQVVDFLLFSPRFHIHICTKANLFRSSDKKMVWTFLLSYCMNKRTGLGTYKFPQ